MVYVIWGTNKRRHVDLRWDSQLARQVFSVSLVLGVSLYWPEVASGTAASSKHPSQDNSTIITIGKEPSGATIGYG